MANISCDLAYVFMRARLALLWHFRMSDDRAAVLRRVAKTLGQAPL